jgi:hypothetical protein
VGILALLWNGFGCYDYLMTRLRDADYLASMMPGTDPAEVLAYVDSIPMWAQAGWGLGVWGGLAGSILLLLRSRWAVPVFALSFLGALVTLGREILVPSGPASMHEGAAAFMPYVIILVAALLLWYAWAQRKRGILR